MPSIAAHAATEAMAITDHKAGARLTIAGVRLTNAGVRLTKKKEINYVAIQ